MPTENDLDAPPTQSYRRIKGHLWSWKVVRERQCRYEPRLPAGSQQPSLGATALT